MVSDHAGRTASSRSAATRTFVDRDREAAQRARHRRAADGNPVLLLPNGAVLGERRIGLGRNLRPEAVGALGADAWSSPRRPLRRQVTGLALLGAVAADRALADGEAARHLARGQTALNGGDDTGPKFGGVRIHPRSIAERTANVQPALRLATPATAKIGDCPSMFKLSVANFTQS